MYTHIFLGGTFDRLHHGHEAVLTRAFELADRVTIGLTSDIFVAKFKIQNSKFKFESYEKRNENLFAWLKNHSYEHRVTVICIDDPYEPAASMDDLDALIVTADNRSRGEEINSRRMKKGLPELSLVEVPIVSSEDTKPISSVRIRNGEIDHTGRLILPDNLRPELSKPLLGAVLVGDSIGSSIESHRSGIIIAVGDITTQALLTAGVVPNLSIVDFLVARKPYRELDGRFTKLNLYRVPVKSGPGFIAQEAVDSIKKWATHPRDTMAVIVDGEEDLLALPAIAYAPAGSVVYYGQPSKGIVEVVVNDATAQKAAQLLARFITQS